MKKSFFQADWSKALQLQSYLTRHQYFSKDSLPGIADALMFQIFDREFPDRYKYPYLYYWYINVKQFSPEAISSWSLRSDKDLYFLDILNRYQHRQNADFQQIKAAKSDIQQNESAQAQFINAQFIYLMNVRFKKINERELNYFKKHILQKTQILCFQLLGDIANIKIKCDALKIELIKNSASLCKNIITYEVEKEKIRKFSRAQTFAKN